MKRLLILRHAKSSWDHSALTDWERPLSARGVRDAPRVGELLRTQALIPDLIVTSDAVRARTTAQAVAQAAGYTGDISVEPSLYHASADDIVAVLNTVADDLVESVLVVGHNPGLEELVERLSGEHHGLPTAALVQLALPIERWRDLDRSAGGSLIDVWRPDS